MSDTVGNTSSRTGRVTGRKVAGEETEASPIRVVLHLGEAEVNDDGVGMMTRLRVGWPRVLILALSFSALGLAGSFLVSPKYDAEVTLVHVRSDASNGALTSLIGQAGALGAIAGLGLGPNDQLRSEDLETLRSRAFTKAFIKERNLLPVLFASDWDSTRQKWKFADPADVPSLEDAYRFFDDDVRYISEDRKTGVLKLVIRWDDPVLAADWANEMVRKLNSYLRGRAISDANRNIEYLNKKIAATESLEIRGALYRLLEAETKAAMLANVREDFAFRVIDPAQPKEADDISSPKRLIIAVLSALVGTLLGLILVFRPSRGP